MPEFDAGVGGGELPIDMDVAAVAAVFPDARLLAHFLASGDAAIETLASECAQFRLGGVQPAPVVGRVDQLALLRYPQVLVWLERLVFRDELLGLLIHADDGLAGIVRPFIDLQHLLHVGYKRRVLLGRNAPHLLPPRLQVVFFSAWRTVSCEIESTTSRLTRCSANSRNVQRAWPRGAGEQASAVRRASPSPSSFGAVRRWYGSFSRSQAG